MTLADVHQWAARWGVPKEAIAELLAPVGPAEAPANVPQGDSEAYTQSLARLAAPAAGFVLWRNNVGVLQDINGRPVRYGLANDSKQLNAVLKSGDLIGWRRVVITPAHVGQTVAQFASIECKRAGWTWRGDAHETAQYNWQRRVLADGGVACFSTGGLPE